LVLSLASSVLAVSRLLLSFPTRRSSDLFVFCGDLSTLPTRTSAGEPVGRPRESSRFCCGGDGSGYREIRSHRHRNRTVTIHAVEDRKSTRLNSSHEWISYAVFCLKKKKD